MGVLAEKKGIRRCEFEEKLESAREFGDEKETIRLTNWDRILGFLRKRIF